MPWSPSSVADFMACPRLWWLKRQGVQGRARDTQAMDTGTEFHAVMAAYWRSQPSVASPLVQRAVERVTKQEGDTLREHGVVGVEVNLDGDDEEAARHGRYPGTCDLVTDNGTGLTVTDYKTKLNMPAQYADRELRQTQRSWQLRQYAWFAQAKYGRPVTQVRKLLVALGPALKVWLVAYPVTQQELSDWHMQAEIVWHDMDVAESCSVDLTVQHEQSCERYGWEQRCDFYDVCWSGADATSSDD